MSMSREEIRIESLKMALDHAGDHKDRIEIAADFAAFIEGQDEIGRLTRSYLALKAPERAAVIAFVEKLNGEEK